MRIQFPSRLASIPYSLTSVKREYRAIAWHVVTGENGREAHYGWAVLEKGCPLVVRNGYPSHEDNDIINVISEKLKVIGEEFIPLWESPEPQIFLLNI